MLLASRVQSASALAVGVEKGDKAVAEAGSLRREHIDNLIRQAEDYQASGNAALAAESLDEASRLIRDSDDALLRARLEGSQGRKFWLGGDLNNASASLARSVRLARVAGDPATLAASLNNLGMVRLARGDAGSARSTFREAARLAAGSGDALLRVSASINGAKASIESGDVQSGTKDLRRAESLARGLPDSSGKAYRLMAIGQAWMQLPEDTPGESDLRLSEPYTLFRSAGEIGAQLSDPRIRSWAEGYLGELYERQSRGNDALTLYRRAAFQAQRADAPELLYRWDWATGRLRHKAGDDDAAIEAYRRSVFQLQRIRHDLHGVGGASFRTAVEPVYFELADALVTRAALRRDPSRSQADLREARDTVEQLKAAELEDYFRDECVESLRGRVTVLDRVAPGTAVLYPILLPERAVLLVGTDDTLTQFTVPVSRSAFTREVRAFRRLLEKRTTREYRPHAQQLYQWLVAPLHGLLDSRNIDTIVLVPDGPLRTIPLAALHDGKRFLVEDYAIANTPGLSLTDHRPLPAEETLVLASGITESVQGYPALGHVSMELEGIGELYDAKVLRDEAFRLEPVRQTLTETPYSIVHIASHGEFGSEVDGSFLLTYDGRLTMDQLERYMGLGRYRERPVELLTLSACRTAAGDDRAALGLAGVGVKAGARSALATLWTINDEASTVLVTEFYRGLKEAGLSKAEALRAAQLGLLGDRRYRHPGYWSPFLLIGNWL